MKTRFRIGKKGFFQMISDIVICVVIVIIGILALSAVTIVNKSKNTAQGEQFMKQAVLQNNIALYLKQNVEIEGMKLTMADLIVLAAENPSQFKTKWERESQYVFSSESALRFNYLAVKNTNLKLDPYKLGKSARTISTFLPSHKGILEVVFGYDYNMLYGGRNPKIG